MTRQSLRWRLPLLVCGLVTIVLTTFLSAAYLQVRLTLVDAAGERAQVAADLVASLLDGRRTSEQINQLSSDPAVHRFLETPTDESRQALLARLKALTSSPLRRVDVWNAAGERVLEISAPAQEYEQGRLRELPSASPPFTHGVNPLQQIDGVVVNDLVSQIRDGDRTLGFVVSRSTFVENPRGIFSRMVGRDAGVRVGNRRGDVWSSFSDVVPRIPVDLNKPGIAQYRASDGSMRIGAVTHIRSTPWAAWVEFPLESAVSPAARFLKRMVPVALVFLVVATLVIAIVSARITRPLVELSGAAEALAAGDYTRRVKGDRLDEVGRLGRTFNMMAGQIQESQQRLEARVVERTARLEAANNELEAFSYSVSHDLRAPLRSIDGFSQALAEEASAKLSDQERNYLNRVRAAAQRMGELIDDLLELARVGRAELRRSRVNMSDMGRSIVGEMQKRDPDRDVHVEIQDGLMADADRRLVQIVLENLLGNAWKFTKNTTPATIQLGVENVDGFAAFFVRDNGAGFDMTYMDKLFRPFQRLHSDAEFPGTGIGLATVARIIDRHNGRVWAKGTIGGGATVYFTLPPDETGERT